MAAIDINRGTTGVNLPVEALDDIWQGAQESSAVMRLADEIPMAGPGESVDIITGDPTVTWQGESEEAGVSRGSISSKVITPYTASVIVPLSKKFLRDKKKLANEIIKRLPKALGQKFDVTVFGLAAGAPGSNFDTLGAATEVGISGNTWGGLVAARQAVAAGDGVLDGWAIAPTGVGILLGKVDGNGHPLFLDGVGAGSVPRVLGANTYETKHVYLADSDGGGAGEDAQVGYGGEWASAHWGVVENIEIDISKEATINDGGTAINLWQRGMVGVKAEFEIGFRVEDIARFAKLTDATQA